ncbi:MAG: anti-sigma factor [Flavobacteriaceae bacterium]|nr:anti-sigma factor [Flavobacteriaceae bacterium]
MNIKEYIASGILELYIAGSLSEKENEEIYHAIIKHPELLEEVLKIEQSIVMLTAATATKDAKFLFSSIKDQLNIQQEPTVIPIRKSNWISYTGWAASILIGSGLVWSIIQNNDLKDQIAKERTQLEQQIERASTDLAEAEKLITVFRDREIISVPLDGQPISPQSYAKVYWDKKTNSIYLDAQGLSEPPEGKVYQLWSLKLNPLTPTSMGVIADFTTDDNKIFIIDNPNDSEAFAITLEPKGGSKSPTLEQLYTLGTVSNP